MKPILLACVAALALSGQAFAGGATLADRCIAHASKGAVTVFRDVDVLGSGRARIAYFRCVRSGLRDDSTSVTFAGIATVVAGPSGSTHGLSGFNL